MKIVGFIVMFTHAALSGFVAGAVVATIYRIQDPDVWTNDPESAADPVPYIVVSSAAFVAFVAILLLWAVAFNTQDSNDDIRAIRRLLKKGSRQDQGDNPQYTPS